ncbi:MAG: phospholipase D-like domain-containing protein [Hyphomicrobiaceae bacterium]
MRRKIERDGLSVHAVGGTYVVMLGIDMREADCDGLLGFAIHRTDHTETEAHWMTGLKTFQETDPGFPPGAKVSTRQHPIQGFTWSDYSAKPGHRYTYRIVALKGTPRRLDEVAAVSVEIATESPEGGSHDVYFNRGVAASQEYVRRFGNRSPAEAGPAAFVWLSRGLYEAMTAFIDPPDAAEYEYRISAYEFYYEPFLQAIKAAHAKGAAFRILYDRRKDQPGTRNEQATEAAGIADFCLQRRATPSALSHNKFIVRLKNRTPEAVWTGGTNFSEGGIFGHSNVAHVVEDATVAAAYNAYWEALSADPENTRLKPALTAMVELPDGPPPAGTTAVFSPRSSLDALDWYASLARSAREGLFMTFAFGMNEAFQDVYRESTALLRYALLEKKTRPMAAGPQRTAEEDKIDRLRRMAANRFAIGGMLNRNLFDRWLTERLSNLNKNVRYVHNKFMLVDPLSADPIVVAGSANFSAASTNQNDENMLVIRGDTRVADIYLGEFMRLYNHHAFREWAAQRKDESESPKHLSTEKWWRDYFGNTVRSRQRQYFAGVR